MVGVVHQKVQLSGKVATADAVHISQIGSVHANQQVVLLVVSVGELSCRVTTTGDSVFCQLAPCWWIDWIADLLPAGGCRFDLEL